MKQESNIRRLDQAVLEDMERLNERRREVGFDEIQIEVRNCIACGELFETTGLRTCGCNYRRDNERSRND